MHKYVGIEKNIIFVDDYVFQYELDDYLFEEKYKERIEMIEERFADIEDDFDLFVQIYIKALFIKQIRYEGIIYFKLIDKVLKIDKM
jgi:hypothetical protein